MTLPLQPLHIVTDWGASGFAALGALLASACAAGFFYWRALRRRTPFSLPVVLLLCAAGLAIAWCAPVLFSSDVYAYAAYGEMARVGLNPYALAPVNTPDAAIRAAEAQWVSAFPICVYGPAFVALARFVMTAFAPLGLLVALDVFRVLASLALLLCAGLAYVAYRGDGHARVRAAATIGLNPVAIWCAAEGHNDVLALAVVLAGFALAARRFIAIGAIIISLSALIKAPGAIAAVGLAAADRRARIGAAVGIAIAAACSASLFAGLIDNLAPHGHYAPQASLQAVFAPLGRLPSLVIAATIAVALALQGVTLLRRGLDEGWIWLGLGGWVLLPNAYPWYALWLLALAPLGPRTRAASAAILLSFTSLLRYVPDAIGMPDRLLSIALGIFAALPLACLIPLRARSLYNERLV